MTDESEKYEKVLKVLRAAKPELKGIETLEEKVIDRLRRTQNKRRSFSDLAGNLFGWIYVGWVRWSLVAASAFLVMFFIYQQTIILREVNNLSKRTIVTGAGEVRAMNDEISRQLRMYKLTGNRFTGSNPEFSESQIKQLLDSYSELQEKYGDLVKIIEEDPELKRYIERKLNAGKNNKSDL